MNSKTDTSKFDALDECHRQIQEHLEDLQALMRQIEADGVNEQTRAKAGVIEAFFSGTSREHHLEEERTVFPPLLASDNAALVSAVRTLQQDHGWIEENWLELAPRLRALASGTDWLDETEFLNYAQVFVDLLNGHIALEETLIYPESKARWAAAVEARVTRLHPAKAA